MFRITYTDENGTEQSSPDMGKIIAEEEYYSILKNIKYTNVKLFEVDATGKQVIREIKKSDSGAILVILMTIVLAFIASINFLTAFYLFLAIVIIYIVARIISAFTH